MHITYIARLHKSGVRIYTMFIFLINEKLFLFTVDFCLLPSKTGPCKARQIRYFYNRKSGKCEQFIYGGCRGNKNNFLTMTECRNQCRRKGNKPSILLCYFYHNKVSHLSEDFLKLEIIEN